MTGWITRRYSDGAVMRRRSVYFNGTLYNVHMTSAGRMFGSVRTSLTQVHPRTYGPYRVRFEHAGK